MLFVGCLAVALVWKEGERMTFGFGEQIEKIGLLIIFRKMRTDVRRPNVLQNVSRHWAKQRVRAFHHQLPITMNSNKRPNNTAED